MSPGMWHWSCCCGGEGVGVGYLFAQHYNTRKPVVVTITNGGDISYDVLDPTGFDANSNRYYFPASTTSGLLMFMYRLNTGNVRVGSVTAPGEVWGYASASLDGGSFAASEFRDYDRIHIAPDDTVRGYLSGKEVVSAGSILDYTDLGTLHTGRAWTVEPVTWDRWQTYEGSIVDGGVTYDQAELWKFGAPASETLESFLDGRSINDQAAGSLMDGRVWSIWQHNATSTTDSRLRVYVRTSPATYQTVDIPDHGANWNNSIVLDAHTADIDGDEVVLVLARRRDNFVFPSSYDYYYYYYVINTDTWAVSSALIDSTSGVEGMHYGAITSTEENVPCVVLTGDTDGEQLTFYLGSGGSWTPYTTAHAGGFYRMTLSVAWQPYLGL